MKFGQFLNPIHIKDIYIIKKGTPGMATAGSGDVLSGILTGFLGYIDDEFDEEDRIIEKVNDTTFIVDGNVYLDDLEEETGVELESETSETIGGFIIDLMGEIPRENIKYKPISYEDYDFTILSVKDRRIEKIRIEKAEREESSDE